MLWDKDKPLVVIDTETTGLSTSNATIVTLGAVILNTGEDEDPHFYMECWPGDEWFEDGKADQALAYNGLTQEVLMESGRDQWQMADEFYSWCRQYIPGNEPIPMTSYNVGFDKRFMTVHAFEEYVDDWQWEKCVMQAFRETLCEGKYNVKAASEQLSIVRKGRVHNALSDARVAVDILRKIQEWEEVVEDLVEHHGCTVVEAKATIKKISIECKKAGNVGRNLREMILEVMSNEKK